MWLIWMILQTTAHATESNAVFKSERACEPGEKWSIELTQKSNWVKKYDAFMNNQDSPFSSFSEALQLKKISNLLTHGDFEAEFSEYWVGRVFFDLELYPLAYQFLNSTLENSQFPELRKAALSCLNEIYLNMPDWNSHLNSPSALISKAPKDILIYHLYHQKPTQDESLPIHYRNLINGVAAVKNRDHSKSIHYLNSYDAWVPTHADRLIDPYDEMASLFLARALYSVGRFNEAVDVFQKISKRSNLQIDTMNDLAWAYLLSNRYAEALGIALQLKGGALKSVFAPESLMIAAMALNETCAFPDAARMIQSFVRDYSQPFEWLISKHPGLNPYNEVIQGLKGTSSVPAKIRSEWMKSENFLSRQKELNYLIQNTKKIAGMPARVQSFQSHLAVQNVEVLKELIHDLRIANLQVQVDPALSQRVLTAKKEIRRFIRLNQSNRIFIGATSKFSKTIPSERNRIISLINQDLDQRSKGMLALLKRIRENIDLVEIEVYNGASRELAKTMESTKEPAKAPNFDSAASWSWGRFPASEMEEAEIWEDELGALKADLANHCD